MIGQNQGNPSLTTNIFNQPSRQDNLNVEENLNRQQLLSQYTVATGRSADYSPMIKTNVNDIIEYRSDSNAIQLENELLNYQQDLNSYLSFEARRHDFAMSIPEYSLFGVNTDGTVSITRGVTGDWMNIEVEHLFIYVLKEFVGKTILSVQTGNPLEFYVCTTDFTLYHLQIKLSGPRISHIVTNLTEKTGKTFKKVAEAPDNSLIGIGTDNNLYVNYNSQNNSAWMGPIPAINGNIKIIDFAICPDDSVYGVGSDYQIYRCPSYHMMNGGWTPLSPAVSNVKAITVAPDGKLFAIMNGGSGGSGTVSYLESWNHPHGSWLPLGSTCCFTSLTTFSNILMKVGYGGVINSDIYKDLLQSTADMEKLVANNPQYFGTVGEQVGDASETNKTLTQIYNNLLADQKNIDKTLGEFETMDDDEKEQTKYLESQNMMFRVVFVVFLILLIFTLKEITGSQYMFNDPLSYFFFACVILASIGLFKGSFGFFLFGLLCLALVFIITSMNR